MEGATPARLYATLVGAVLVVAGIVGFFYSSSFGSPGHVGDMLGVFAVNGWHNILRFLAGATGLLVAGYAARRYALWLGIAFVAVAIWGFVLGAGHSIVGLVPVDTGDNLLHLALGLLGVGAAVATPADGPREAAAA
jgi:Domain of unknown function (DUF4383)